MACPVRLRPILMTSVATAWRGRCRRRWAGARGGDAGADGPRHHRRHHPLTLVTLILVPVFYVLIDRFGSLLTRLAKRDGVEEETPPHLPSLNGTNGKHEAKDIALPATPTAAT